MKLLFIVPYTPYPLDSGGNQAFFSMIENIRRDNEVHLITPVFPHDEENFNALKGIWTDVEFHPYRYGEERPTEFVKEAVTEDEKRHYNSPFFNFITYLSASSKRKIARYRRKHPRLIEDCGELVRKHSMLIYTCPFLTEGFLRHVENISRDGFDCIQVEFYEFLPLYRFLPEDTFRIFVHHELHFVRLENELALFGNATHEERLLAERHKMEEIGMLSRYDRIITLTETDRKILSDYLPQEKISVSPAIITVGKQQTEFKECGADFVFIGGNGHFPNYDGVNWLCREILPELRKRMSSFRIHIVGRWDKKIAALYSIRYPEVVFEGFVPDIQNFLSGKISIVPIRIGSGMRMKILDAVNSHSPFITTEKGVEGQDFVNGTDCIIADSAEAFAEAMESLSRDTALQRTLAANAFTKLHSMYDPEEMLKIRKDIYSEIADRL